MYYTIESESGVGYALSIDIDPGQNDLRVYTNDASDDRQRWLPVAWFGDDTTPVGFVLVNMHSGLAAFSPPSAGANSVVTQIALSEITSSNVGQATWTFVDHDGSSSVIRTTGDKGRNMNVKGGSATSGAQIIVFGWDGGKDNELWVLRPVLTS